MLLPFVCVFPKSPRNVQGHSFQTKTLNSVAIMRRLRLYLGGGLFRFEPCDGDF